MSVVSVSGGNLAKVRAAFSSDGSLFMCASASHVKVFSARTGDELATLCGHSAEVTAVVASPFSSRQALTASLDGAIGVWDLTDGAMLQRFELGAPVHGIHISRARPDLALVALAEPQADGAAADSSGGVAIKLRTAQLEAKGGRLVAIKLLNAPSKKTKKGARTAAADALAGAPQLPPSAAADGAAGSVSWLLGKRLSADAPVAATSVNGVPYYAGRARTDERAMRVCAGLSGETIELRAGASIRALALHPSQLVVALGDGDGVVTVWFLGGAPDAADAPAGAELLAGGGVRALKHWHAFAVGALCFSADGSLLLSGGAEAALVLWRTRGAASERRIVPRVGAPIVALTASADGSLYAISCADNAIRLMSATTLELVAACRGLQPAAAAGRALALTAARGELVLPVRAAPGTLQFWSLGAGRQSRTLVVAPSNVGAALPVQESALVRARHAGRRVRGGSAAAAAAPLNRVTRLAFTADGRALCTVEERAESEGQGAAIALKFWEEADDVSAGDAAAAAAAEVKAAAASGSKRRAQRAANAAAAVAAAAAAAVVPPSWVLHTRVDAPHERGVSALACAPQGARRLAVTASLDGSFKIWTWAAAPPPGTPPTAAAPSRAAPPLVGGGAWSCAAVGGYRKAECVDAAFSSDGSILAVLHARAVSIWEPDSCSLLRVLSAPAGRPAAGLAAGARAQPPLTALLLGGAAALAAGAVNDGTRAAAPLALAHGGGGAVAWELSSGAVVGHWSMAVQAMAADPATGELLLCAALRTDADDELPAAAAAASGASAGAAGARGKAARGAAAAAATRARRVHVLIALSPQLCASAPDAPARLAAPARAWALPPGLSPTSLAFLPPSAARGVGHGAAVGGTGPTLAGALAALPAPRAGSELLALSTHGELWQLRLDGAGADGAAADGARALIALPADADAARAAGAASARGGGRGALAAVAAARASASAFERAFGAFPDQQQQKPDAAAAGAAAGAGRAQCGRMSRWVASTFGSTPAHALPPLTTLFESFAKVALGALPTDEPDAATAAGALAAGGGAQPPQLGLGGLAARAAAANAATLAGIEIDWAAAGGGQKRGRDDDDDDDDEPGWKAHAAAGAGADWADSVESAPSDVAAMIGKRARASYAASGAANGAASGVADADALRAWRWWDSSCALPQLPPLDHDDDDEEEDGQPAAPTPRAKSGNRGGAPQQQPTPAPRPQAAAPTPAARTPAANGHASNGHAKLPSAAKPAAAPPSVAEPAATPAKAAAAATTTPAASRAAADCAAAVATEARAPAAAAMVKTSAAAPASTPSVAVPASAPHAAKPKASGPSPPGVRTTRARASRAAPGK